MSDYPEHDKLKSISDKSQAIGEFLEWLRDEKGVTLAVLETKTDCKDAGGFGRGKTRWRCVDGRAMAGDGNSTDIGECDECDGTGQVDLVNPRLVRGRLRTTDLLAEFFGIDQEKLEDEKREILENL